MAQTRFVTLSASLAAMVGEELKSRVEVGQQAVEQAPLRVLVGANMPAVLVEMGYLSNPEQEHQLASDAYQGQLVQALAEAIARYRTYLDQAAHQATSLRAPSQAGTERRTP
jgi:N-acetylmuramoyl-L-alanine amidase